LRGVFFRTSGGVTHPSTYYPALERSRFLARFVAVFVRIRRLQILLKCVIADVQPLAGLAFVAVATV
jgi:hypothetical protein